MDESQYQQALRREAAWLDEQLQNYVARQRRPSDAADDTPVSAATVTAARGISAVDGGRPGLRFEEKPLLASDSMDVDQPVSDTRIQAPVEFGIAQPPEPSLWRKKMAAFSVFHSVLLLLLLVSAGFAIWQTMQANIYKKQADQAASNIQKWGDAQLALDDALCASGYPDVVSAIRQKEQSNTVLSSSEKALLAFGDYRTAVPNVAGDSFRVDADPPCAEIEEQSINSGVNPPSETQVGAE